MQQWQAMLGFGRFYPAVAIAGLASGGLTIGIQTVLFNTVLAHALPSPWGLLLLSSSALPFGAVVAGLWWLALPAAPARAWSIVAIPLATVAAFFVAIQTALYVSDWWPHAGMFGGPTRVGLLAGGVCAGFVGSLILALTLWALGRNAGQASALLPMVAAGTLCGAVLAHDSGLMSVYLVWQPAVALACWFGLKRN